MQSLELSTQHKELSLRRLEEGLQHERQDEPSCCSRVGNVALSAFSEVANLIRILNAFYYRHTNRLVRNIVRVAIAGGMSTIGGGISGDPRVKAFFKISAIAAVWLGSGVGGFGNALSTYLAWETGIEDQVAELERELQELRSLVQSRGDLEDERILKVVQEALESLKQPKQEVLLKIINEP